MLGAAAAIACLPALAQNHGDKATDELTQARRIAVLVEAGQVRASIAAQLAETQTKGTALSIESRLTTTTPDEKAGEAEGTTDQRVIYEVRCLDQSKNKLQTVLVDGRTRKVSEVNPHRMDKSKP